MPVDRFTTRQFEAALDTICANLQPDVRGWKAMVGLDNGEWCYLVMIDEFTGVYVRSSIDGSGVSASTGEDSIRAYLVTYAKPPHTGPNAPLKTEPLGTKVSRWTTRVPGWQDRLQTVVWTLVFWRKAAGNCEVCEAPKRIFRVKKDGPTKGKLFAKCMEHQDVRGNFTWLPEGAEEGPVKASQGTVEPSKPAEGTQARLPFPERGETEASHKIYAMCLASFHENLTGSAVHQLTEEEQDWVVRKMAIALTHLVAAQA